MKQKYQAQGSTSDNKMCVCVRAMITFSLRICAGIFFVIYACAQNRKEIRFYLCLKETDRVGIKIHKGT